MFNQIELYLSWDEAREVSFEGAVVLVIDLLRVTTTITTALESGARSVRSVAGLESASHYKESNPEVLLCGERGGFKVEGFDLGNSPLEYTPQKIKDRDLVVSSTNGTQALALTQEAEETILLCLRNQMAVLEYLREKEYSSSRLILLCSGTEKFASLDDIICGGLFLHEYLSERSTYTLNDGGYTAWWLTEDPKQAIKRIEEAQHYKRLQGYGFERDLEFCLERNCSKMVPVYDKESGFIKEHL